uniref:Retrovirus-related Pol polyprotein from transposon TNT 1-94 n=1 Tax=Tanacetum cinerariifolium TaxID=118510 RepID=A0A699JRF8_TANCI|nr:hypothetical protein [Tanacetum cinerariifolium]
MNPVVAKQVDLDNDLVPPEKRLKIEKCNARIEFSKLQREATYQIKDTDAYNFKLDKKKCQVDTEVFREILHICPRLPNQNLVEPPSEEELVTFSRNLVTLASVICCLQSILIKCTSLEEHLMRSSIDFMYQADNREISSAKKEHMHYLRFTKVIINHFISKDKTISIGNRINIYTMKFVSKTEDYNKYGELIPGGMINQDIKDSKAYKTYYDFATGKATPKKARKFKKVASPSMKLSPVLEEEPVKKPKKAKKPAKKSTTTPTACVVIRDTPGVFVSKKKAPAKVDRGKGMDLLSNAALLKAAQLKEALNKSKKDSHMPHASGSVKVMMMMLTVMVMVIMMLVILKGRIQMKKSHFLIGKMMKKKKKKHTMKSDYYVPTHEETNDENKEFDEDEYDELYKDVNVRSKVAEHEEVEK